MPASPAGGDEGLAVDQVEREGATTLVDDHAGGRDGNVEGVIRFGAHQNPTV